VLSKVLDSLLISVTYAGFCHQHCSDLRGKHQIYVCHW